MVWSTTYVSSYIHSACVEGALLYPVLSIDFTVSEDDLRCRTGVNAPGEVTAVTDLGIPEALNGATQGRKADHIRINLEEDVSAKGITNGFEHYRFLHRALPEIHLSQVNLSVDVFGRRLAAPIFMSCMTGGVPEAGEINAALASVAQELGLAIGVGSGRVLLEHPEVLPTFDVRRHAPDALVFANIGAVQLNLGVGVQQCRQLVDMIGADALALHLNPLQEALQPEGDTDFGGLLDRIADLCVQLPVPVVVKEVGWGIAPDVVQSLLAAGVAAVDVAGAGGTSWSEVERHRMDNPVRRRVAAAFADWGVPTAEAIRGAHLAAPGALIFASGGIRSGMDAAKAIALGASMVGVAGPFLRAASQGRAAICDLAEEYIETLRTAMFCIGVPTLSALRDTPRLVSDTAMPTGTYAERLFYATEAAGQFLDITDDVAALVRRSGVRNGLVAICSSHTTAAIRVNENEPLLLEDFRRLLDRLVPAGNFEHDDLSQRVGVPLDEPINGHAHCRHLLLSTSESLPVTNGALPLGPYQRIFLIELCSPRRREVQVQVVGG
jgi:isopentenyl-diphosphate Delta-isomerase